jgi:hypothetical protein
LPLLVWADVKRKKYQNVDFRNRVIIL